MDRELVQRTIRTPDGRVLDVNDAGGPGSLPVLSSEPVVCTLTSDDRGERVGAWRQLLARADHREPIEGGLRFELPASLAGLTAELAAAEQQCCTFFDFTLHLAGGALHLEVRAPAEAAPLVREVFGVTR
jgi:MerR family transcriptional regulator, copper efflux regulator